MSRTGRPDKGGRRRGRRSDPKEPVYGGGPLDRQGRNAPRCRECPMLSRKTRWCPLRAEPETGDGAACRYGIGLIADSRKGLGDERV